jgi:transposase
MLALSSTSRIFLCRHATDMRKSYDGLSYLVESRFGENPLCGDFFVFLNARRDRMKILFWDNGGYCLFCKRLEKGRFRFPQGEQPRIDRASLSMILEGIDEKKVRRLPRYSPRDC